MLQIRYSTGDTYAYERDIVQLYPVLSRMAAYGLAASSWGKELKDYAEFCGLSEADLMRGTQALVLFQETASEYATAEEAYIASGFATLPPAVQLAVTSKLGLAAMAKYHQYVRASNKEGHVPRQADGANERIEEAEYVLSAPSPRARLARAEQLSKKLIADGDPLGEV